MPNAVRVVDRIIDQGDYSALLALAAGDVLRYSGSAWRNYPSTGTTLPSSPVVGQVFRHAPTGRVNIMIYDGTVWRPILSLGTWTIYVDGTNGTDSQDNGFGMGSNAFRTIQYAVDQIAPVFTGNITIEVAAGTYSETVNVRGKAPQGAVGITIRGTLTVVESVTATGGTQGSGASHGTVTASAWGSHENKWLQGKSGSNNNVFRIIDSISGSTATIVGYWSAAPSSGDSFDVVEPGTSVNQINASDAQIALTIENIAFAYADGGSFSNVPLNTNANVTWRRCRQVWSTGSNMSFGINAAWTIEECFFDRARFFVGNDATLTFRSCKFLRPHASGSGGRILHVFLGSKAISVSRPSVIDGGSNGCTGWFAASGANCEGNSLFTIIRNCSGGSSGRGLRAESTGTFTGSANFVYSSNDANTSVDAATYGVIA